MAVFSFANGWPGREPVIRPVLMSGTLHNCDFECVSAMLASRRRHSQTRRLMRTASEATVPSTALPRVCGFCPSA
jgi:hypothetical protein